MTLTLAQLRAHVVRRAFGRPTTLAAAVARMGFVQADPIRAPARAQDLILRHRVAGYRDGDLEREYPALDLDEDVLYAYGFVTPAVRRLLHPGAVAPPHGLAGEVLAYVREAGTAHPTAVAERLGATRERNAWGGQSRATTRALEGLHARGLLRVARRERGVRVYAVAPSLPAADVLSRSERLRGLTRYLAGLFAPLPEAGLRRVLRYVPFVRREVTAREVATMVRGLVRGGELEEGSVDGETWVWPAGEGPRETTRGPRVVRMLAPFDPVVWDRGRFERLWGVGVSVRGVRAGGEARARVLRAAGAVGGARGGLGERGEEGGGRVGVRGEEAEGGRIREGGGAGGGEDEGVSGRLGVAQYPSRSSRPVVAVP